MAQSRRRNRNVEENLNEVVDSSADTDALEEVDAVGDEPDDAEVTDVDLDDDVDTDDDLDDDLADDDEDDVDEADEADEPSSRRARRAKEKALAKAKDKTPADDREVKVDLEDSGPGIFGRFGRFVREVVAELRKVIWPSRKDLLVYATVVIVFVAIMLTLVGTLDWAFARAVLWVFSGN